MITRLGVENRNLNSIRTSPYKENKLEDKNPSFKGGTPWTAILWGMQKCEENPMINVAVVDMLSAILPRTWVESKTNWFAGFEAFRREASGLVVNCMIPGAIAWLTALGLNKIIMPKNINMAQCWADHSLIDKLSETYTKSSSNDKIKDSLKEILSNIKGRKGKLEVNFGETLKSDIAPFTDRLNELVLSNDKKLNLNKEIKKISKEIAEKTHVYENITIKGDKDISAKSIETVLEDSVKFFKEFRKTENVSMEEFAKKSKKLVKGKSILGLAIILPLAASMQTINRWITEKVSGVEGAPIYEDFGESQNEELRKQGKEGLLKQKLISISSMIGVSLLSMMKRPAWNMLEFKGWFPTMDQARIISTTTFASRMAVADDKNELAEATVRDIATFSGLYFLGDYAGKATATLIEKKYDVKLLNDSNPLNGKKNIFQRFWHWVKDVNIKSSEEVISNTAEKLEKEKLKPNNTQKEIIKKEIKRAKNFRSACQAANLGVSLLLLGFIVPVWTRNKTKKKHAEMLKQIQETGITELEQNEKSVDSKST